MHHLVAEGSKTRVGGECLESRKDVQLGVRGALNF